MMRWKITKAVVEANAKNNKVLIHDIIPTLLVNIIRDL